MKVEIWSDVVCPWCYIGKRHFEEALGRFPHAAEVEVIWRSFELDPSAPPQVDGDPVENLSRKYGVSRERARAMQDRVTAIAREAGLAYRLDIARRGNTRDAHRVLHLARERGVQGTVKERLLRSYLCEGLSIADHETLVRLGSEAGLDAEEAREVLAGDAFTTAVADDENAARALGIEGVPFFVLDRRYGLSGAQPAAIILTALDRAWGASHPLEMVSAGEAAEACTDESCAV